MTDRWSRHLDVEPITADEEFIARALEDLSVPALVASIVQMTGDPSIIRGPIRPRRFIPNEFQGAMSAEELTELRTGALREILAFRDAGSPDRRAPDDELVRELMDWIACEHVPDDYVAMFQEEMDLRAEDPRRLRITVPADRKLFVLVIGCGQSGLLAGIRLAQAGIPFEIVDKNADVGGTWLENTYPGCRVDVANHYYCYSFEPNHGFSQFFSSQPELHAYFREVMDHHDIGEHVRWSTEVERLEWDDRRAAWEVTMRQADGTPTTIIADVVISAVGQLNRPSIPDLPGLERFGGPVIHSARWDDSVKLTGKRVAMIGAGASGFQLGPAIAGQVERLTVFQRTPQWIAPNARYHQSVGAGVAWAMGHLPGYSRWYRFMLLWQASDRMLDVARVDPEWPDLPRSANALSAERRDLLVDWMMTEVGDDSELLAKLIPDYPPLGKRMLQDDGTWLRTLRRANVELVTEPIVGFDEDAVLTSEGRYPADVAIMATGFRANEFLWPMEVIGRDGRTLESTWDGRPAAYLGISVPGFPNLFMMYGPGTNLAHAGSIIFHSECQMRYIGGCLELLVESGSRSIEPTTSAFEHYVERWQAELATTVWAHASVEHSWYKASDGRVYVLSPWPLVEYWKMTERPDPAEHVLR